MDLISGIAQAGSNSYVSSDEAISYIQARDGFSGEDWESLSQEQVDFRLSLSVKILDALPFRGIRATKTQALQFPRLFPGGPLYTEDRDGMPMPFEDWDSLGEYAALKSVEPPNIPEAVKFAQIETAYQVVHSHLLTLEPMDSGETAITSLGIDVINLSFGRGTRSEYDIFSKEQFGASSPIYMYLRPYMTRIRASLV